MTDIWQAIFRPDGFPRTELRAPLSLPDVARRHAEVHRWCESERKGRDVGSGAYREWTLRYWRNFCRWRRLEHLLGVCCYREFKVEDFGKLRDGDFWQQDEETTFALWKLFRDDWENLEVFFSAPDRFSRSRLLRVLDILDINEARVDPPEWAR
jgi:hypothetical protein